jgi:hypothetical protein
MKMYFEHYNFLHIYELGVRFALDQLCMGTMSGYGAMPGGRAAGREALGEIG